MPVNVESHVDLRSSIGERTKPRLIVVCWDMTHNPLGRAYIIADMLKGSYETSVLGPAFPDLGQGLWPPLRTQDDVDLVTFEGADLPNYLNIISDVLSEHKPDVVIVCKPRLPSLLLGLLFGLVGNATVLVDIDDFELSFFAERSPLDLADALTLAKSNPDQSMSPHGEIWTRYAEVLMRHASGYLVSNEALKDRYGGTIVRHARSEIEFAPDPSVRAQARRELGLGTRDTVIMFFGTVRPHKGIERLIKALGERLDSRHILVVVGTIKDAGLRQNLKAAAKPRIKLLPDQSWDTMRRMVQAADVIPLLQDETSPISMYQFPAKLSEALAFGIPAIVTDVLPMRAFAHSDAITIVKDDAALQDALDIVVPLDQRPPGHQASRELFLTEFSYTANEPRLTEAISKAERGKKSLDREALRQDIERLFSYYDRSSLLREHLR